MFKHGRKVRSVNIARRFCRGFTIVELVTVVVILGILAAVALPNYNGLTGDARTSSDAGVAGAIAAAVANKTAACKGGLATGCPISCSDAGSLLNPPVTTGGSSPDCTYNTAKFTIP
jgi:prepilin-type N-terminal cleavage/methylation domain-containing protein